MSGPRATLHPVGGAGLVLFAAGCVAWAWTDEWRWGVTGAAVLLVAAAIGAALDGRRNR